MKARAPAGFTLIEVVIALAVVSISLTAALATVRASAANTAHVYDVILSDWALSDATARLRIERPDPELYETSRTTVMILGRPYVVTSRYVPAGDGNDRPFGDFVVTVSLPGAAPGAVLRETKVHLDAQSI